eukprot:m.137918 g.137918  ORF g.137918 m.137918 type:complete len:141 (-) comp29958_c1_seq2:121-543(-)
MSAMPPKDDGDQETPNVLDPDNMTNIQLIAAMDHRGISHNDTCARDGLLVLFRKHVMPRPQRQPRDRRPRPNKKRAADSPQSVVIKKLSVQTISPPNATATQVTSTLLEQSSKRKAEHHTEPSLPIKKSKFVVKVIKWEA